MKKDNTHTTHTNTESHFSPSCCQQSVYLGPGTFTKQLKWSEQHLSVCSCGHITFAAVESATNHTNTCDQKKYHLLSSILSEEKYTFEAIRTEVFILKRNT